MKQVSIRPKSYTAWPVLASVGLGLILLFPLMRWASSSELVAPVQGRQDFPYDLSEVDQKHKLPDKLKEISGLSYMGKKTLACIQDEKGKIYSYKLKKEDLKNRFEFAGKGDFEGIEIIGDTAYALESNGYIHAVYGLSLDSPIIKTFKDFPLPGADVEGLGWDPVSRNLLVAVKDPQEASKRMARMRPVYSFSPVQEAYFKKPYLTISTKAIASMIGKSDASFYPSGIAVHPVELDIYVIASAGNLIAVINRRNSKPRMVERLPGSIFRQPEGICFEPDGDMYISNEGRDKRSNILKFDYLKKEKSGS